MCGLADILQIAVVIRRVVFFSVFAMFVGCISTISFLQAKRTKFSAIFPSSTKWLSERNVVSRACLVPSASSVISCIIDITMSFDFGQCSLVIAVDDIVK